MSDPLDPFDALVGEETNREGLRAEVRPGSVGLSAEDPNKFPFDAFNFEDPNANADPILSVIQPWTLQYNGSTLAIASADYTITDTDPNTVLVTTGASDRTVTLPTSADNTGREIILLKVDSGSGSLVIDGEGSETIGRGGALTRTIQHQGGAMRIVSDGTNWEILLGEYQVTTFDIGDWNMVPAVSITVAHGLNDHTMARQVQAVIRDDNGTNYYGEGDFADGTGAVTGFFSHQIDATSVRLERATGGTHTTTAWDSPSYNRGWISVTYATA